MNETLLALLGGLAGGAVAFCLWLWAVNRQLKRHRLGVTEY